MNGTPNDIVLPPGVTIAASRETSQLSSSGNQLLGMTFTLTLLNGTTTSVFVPYVLLESDAGRAQVSAMFAQRVAGINAVTALST